MNECDATSSANYNYSAAGCDVSDKEVAVLSSSLTSCEYYTTQIIFDVYRRMERCVYQGAEISDDTYCPATEPPTTAEPTKEPTMTPSASPTAPTIMPTSADTSSVGFYYVSNMVVLVLSVAVYML